jgi:hypothetical protein
VRWRRHRTILAVRVLQHCLRKLLGVHREGADVGVGVLELAILLLDVLAKLLAPTPLVVDGHLNITRHTDHEQD